jgi:dihydropteroate synthase
VGLTPLRLRDRTVTVEAGRPLVMGIVNANPDSFSDDVRDDTLERQVDRAMSLVAEGADLVDVGGESGVTYNEPTPAEREIERVAPLVERLVAEGVTVSVDTWKPAVARAAIAAGAAMLNDVSGLRDLEMASLAAKSGAALVLMHTRAEPKQASFPDYGGDVVGDVEAFLRERMTQALAAGVAEEQLVLDPGPDFAKTPQETVAVLRALPRLHALGRPLLLAISRKYFLGAITGRPPVDAGGRRLGSGRGRRDPARPRCRRGPRPARGQGGPRRPRRRARVRRHGRGAEVDPRRSVACATSKVRPLGGPPQAATSAAFGTP